MKRKHIAIMLLIVILSASIIKICFDNFRNTFDSNSEVLTQSISYNNMFKAVAFIRQDSIDQTDVYNVSILNNKGFTQNDQNIYVGDRLQSIDVCWQNNYNLLISIDEMDSGSNTFKAETSMNNINICYQINTCSTQKDSFEYPIIADESLIVWNNGKFQIINDSDKNNFVIFNKNGHRFNLLKNVNTYKWIHSKLYIKAQNGYAVIDRHDNCKIFTQDELEKEHDDIYPIEYLKFYEYYDETERRVFDNM